MSSYYFKFTNVIISTDAIVWVLFQKFPLIDMTKYFDFTSDATGAADGATIFTTVALSDAQLATLTTLVQNYTDPLYFFPGKWGIVNNPIRSLPTNSADRTLIYTWIYPGQLNVLGGPVKGPGGVINEIKTLVQYDIKDITTAASIINPTITIEIFDTTRNSSIVSNTIDASSIVNAWAESASTGTTGEVSTTKSTMFYDMYNKSTNYDVIFNIYATVSDPRITITLNTLQYICYNQPIYVNPADNPNGQAT
jgi:hypothetical protein